MKNKLCCLVKGLGYCEVCGRKFCETCWFNDFKKCKGRATDPCELTTYCSECGGKCCNKSLEECKCRGQK